jgi:putative toxin-antitoxin system antitoxin component (TIGR02293 family)
MASAAFYALIDNLPQGTGGDWRGVVEATRRGFPVQTVDRLVQTGRLSAAEVDQTIIPRKTLSHRRKIGTLTAEQSDRLARVMRVIAAAEETFGTEAKAAQWLRRPTEALGGEAPIALLDTSEGSREVERLLGRIGHGIAA